MKNYYRIYVTTIIIILFCSANAFAQFAGGSGTAEAPWQIETIEHLNNVRDYLGEDHADKHFIQIADINASGNNWQPIGSFSSRFMGTYHGGDHLIINLTISRPEDNNTGLFGYIQSAKISNLILENVQVQGRGSTGALAGVSGGDSQVTFITVTGNIVGNASYTGGIVGNASGQFSNLSADVTVIGVSSTGGVFGSLGSSAEVRYSYSKGTVSGQNRIGGFAGDGGAATITDCYSTANVTGEDRVGGFTGSGGRIYRSYSIGSVTGQTNVGGFIGAEGSSTPRNAHSYWNTETSGQNQSAGGSGVTGLTTAQMQQQTTYPAFNFYSAWQIDEGSGYPEFQDLSVHTLPEEIDLDELSGSGTEDDPYIITTAHELNAIRQDLEAHYKLNNDLDVTSSVIWNNGRGWTPIGDLSNRFAGSLDGNGKSIQGLTVNNPNTGRTGLFGYIQNAQINNLILENAQMHGGRSPGVPSETGALAGVSGGDSQVTFITVTGHIVGNGGSIGGIVGNASGQFSNLSADVTVIGVSSTGGVFGSLGSSAEVRYSYSKGTVSGQNRIGGFAGDGGAATITDCYSTANVTGEDRVGGFTGSGGRIYRSYSIGSVTGQTNVGGLIGADGSSTPRNAHSYWNTETSGQNQSAGGSGVTGLTTAQMQQQTTYPAFNFYSAWQIDEGSGYPEFQDLSVHTLPEEIDLDELSGSGTEDDPYIITTAHELNAIRQDLEAHYKLNNDLDVTSSVIWNNGRGWTPIGDLSNRFAGSLDGNGKSIQGLTVNNPNTGRTGLFGYVQNAQINNLILENAQMHGGRSPGVPSETGALTGVSGGDSQVTFITVTGHIVGNGGSIGGIVGNASGQFSNLSADVTVIGVSSTGGVFGSLGSSAEVRYSYSKGTVSGQNRIGGFAGDGGAATITDCYSTANVTGEDRVGGFTGSGGRIYRSYSIGSVTGQTNVGGFIGADGSSTPRNAHSYWNTETSGQETSAGGSGVTGLTTADMTFPYATGVYTEWDFVTIWSHDEDHTVNNGYPHLGFGLPTSTENEEDLPRQVKLHQNYPNPFNPVTNIRYDLPQQQEVRLEVFNVLGRRVAVLVSGSQQAGYHSIQFDASRLASGMYLYRLQAGNVVQTHKMMLVK